MGLLASTITRRPIDALHYPNYHVHHVTGQTPDAQDFMIVGSPEGDIVVDAIYANARAVPGTTPGYQFARQPAGSGTGTTMGAIATAAAGTVVEVPIAREATSGVDVTSDFGIIRAGEVGYIQFTGIGTFDNVCFYVRWHFLDSEGGRA